MDFYLYQNGPGSKDNGQQSELLDFRETHFNVQCALLYRPHICS